MTRAACAPGPIGQPSGCGSRLARGIGDDYDTEGGWPEVRRAFDDFFGARGLTPFEHGGNKCRIQKLPPLPRASTPSAISISTPMSATPILSAIGRNMVIVREGRGNDGFHLTPHHRPQEKCRAKERPGRCPGPAGGRAPGPAALLPRQSWAGRARIGNRHQPRGR